MRQKLYGGIGASLALHVIIAAVLFVRLPAAEPVPPEESVSVEIVPPPEPAPPEEPAAEEQPLDLTMPEEKPEEQAQEIPPPPEPPKQEAEEAGGEPPSPQEAAPQAEEAEQAEAEPAQAEAPPPPPPVAEQQAEAEAPPPPPPAPEQPQAEQPQTPPAGSDQAAEQQEQPAEGQPLPVLRPVFEFGDEEAGSEVAQDGSSSENGSEAAADTEAAETETAESAPEAPEPPAPTTEVVEEQAEPPAPALPQDVAPPSIDIADADPLAMSENGTAEGVQADISTEPSAAPENDDAADGEAKPSEKPPTEAKRLFSQKDTDDSMARTAMGSIPRDIRASQLCATELREQLRHGQPAYQPELLPSYRLPEGTVLDIRQAAFRANDQWYNISFRCEIDEKATKVVSFGFDVGNTVPRSEWGARGFPEF